MQTEPLFQSIHYFTISNATSSQTLTYGSLTAITFCNRQHAKTIWHCTTKNKLIWNDSILEVQHLKKVRTAMSLYLAAVILSSCPMESHNSQSCISVVCHVIAQLSSHTKQAFIWSTIGNKTFTVCCFIHNPNVWKSDCSWVLVRLSFFSVSFFFPGEQISEFCSLVNAAAS